MRLLSLLVILGCSPRSVIDAPTVPPADANVIDSTSDPSATDALATNDAAPAPDAATSTPDALSDAAPLPAPILTVVPDVLYPVVGYSSELYVWPTEVTVAAVVAANTVSGALLPPEAPGVYATFTRAPGGDDITATFTAELTWDAVDAVVPINFHYQENRTLLAVFQTDTGAIISGTVVIGLRCPYDFDACLGLCSISCMSVEPPPSCEPVTSSLRLSCEDVCATEGTFCTSSCYTIFGSAFAQIAWYETPEPYFHEGRTSLDCTHVPEEKVTWLFDVVVPFEDQVCCCACD